MGKIARAFEKSSPPREAEEPKRFQTLVSDDSSLEATTLELVPGVKGEMLPADQPVSLSFKVTAKERYLWNLALTKHGMTGVSVLRNAMRELAEKG